MEHFRDDFPQLKRIVQGNPFLYLDTAATALKPSCMIERVQRFDSNEYATVNRAVYSTASEATTQYNQTRSVVREFLGASRDEEIIFTRGTTDSLNIIAQSLASILKPGDEILITEMEHHSNIVPWQMVCQTTGAKLKVVPISDQGELQLAPISSKTKIVSITHISNTLGTINPIQEVVNLAKEVGAIVVCDGAQSAPDLPINVQELGVDFFAFSGHKTYGPTGIGVLYGKYELLKQLPPTRGGGDMIDRVSFEASSYEPPPLKFEYGTPMITQAIGLAESLRYLMQIGMERIHQHKSSLHVQLEEGLKQIPYLQIVGQAKQKAAITSFVVNGVHPLDIGTFLDLEAIACRTGHHCTQPLMDRLQIPGTVRCSLGLYNTQEEVERFCQVLADVISKFRNF